jgi:hypothetical protein
MTEDIRSRLGAQRVADAKRRHRHRWNRFAVMPGGPIGSPACACGAIKDEAKSRKGRNSRARGNAFEREVAAKLGLRRVGQYGGKPDAAGDWITVQCKNGAAFPERLWRWLEELPKDAQRLRALVISDAPGPGHRRREVIVMDLAEFLAWFGPS